MVSFLLLNCLCVSIHMENDFSFQQIRILATTLAVLIPRSHPDQGAPHQVKRAIKSFPVPIVLTSASATGN